MCIFSKDLFFSIFSTKPAYLLARVTIVPDPSDAVVTLTASGYSQKGNYIEVPIGTIVRYKVDKQNLKPSEKEILVVGNTTIPVKLFEPIERIVTIETIPSDASVIFVGDGIIEQGGKSVKAAAGSALSYTVSDPKGELSLTETGSLTVQLDEVINVTMRTKAHITKVLPPDAVVKINGELGSYRELPCNQVMNVSVTRNAYDSFNQTFEKNNRGIVPDFISEVELKETTYILTVESTPTNASLSVIVGTKTYTGTGRVVVDNVLPGTAIKATATLSGYDTVTQTFTMPASNYGKTLPLSETLYPVTITATPSAATVVIKANGSQVASGTGKATTSVKKGTVIAYTVSYKDISESGTHTMSAAVFSKNVVLDAQDSKATLVLTDTSVTLPAGKYKYIAISGGGDGGSGTREPYEYADFNKCGGGGGGGSGYVKVGTFTTAGEVVNFVIGKGGQGAASFSAPAGGATEIQGSLSGTIISVQGGNGGRTGTDTTVSGVVSDTMNGGNGGCGGGGGGRCATKNSNVSSSGGSGGKAGSNGLAAGTGGKGGSGIKNMTSANAGNGGAGVNVAYNSVNLSGGGGTGASSIKNTLENIESFISATESDVYNAMSGGGGGGGTVKHGSYSYGGGGGGGGAWTNGASSTMDNVTAHYSEGGKGGDGAILYARLSWS
jgi:hypothetical protein